MSRAELRPILIALVATLVYLATGPGVVNLDGLGYLKLLPHDFAAGHLAYMPILRTATRLLGGDGLKTGRLIDAILGGSGVLLTYAIARITAPLRSDRTFVATVAAIGTAVSYGYWIECADVEAYALATVALLALVRVALPYAHRPSLGRTIAIGVLLGCAVLTHLSHVLASFFVVAVCSRDPRGRMQAVVSSILALTIGGALSLAVYAYAAFIVRGHHVEGAVRWVLTASHGFSEKQGAYALASSVYGLCRTIVWSPYLYEADAPRLIGQLLLGLAPLIALVALVRSHVGALRTMPLAVLAWLAAPYTLLAIAFFGADPERWIFVLPFLWIIAAVVIDATSARTRWAVLAIVYVGALNLVLAILPAHRDTWSRHLAETAATPLHDGDLLLFPGHAWDEYVSFYGAKAIEPFPLSYYAARDGQDRMWARLDREVGAAHARGHAVYALRIFDDARTADDDPGGYAELRTSGLPRARLRAALEARFRVTPIPLSDGIALVRLDPLSTP